MSPQTSEPCPLSSNVSRCHILSNPDHESELIFVWQEVRRWWGCRLSQPGSPMSLTRTQGSFYISSQSHLARSPQVSSLYYPKMTAIVPSITCRNKNVSSRKYLLLHEHLFLRMKKTFLQKPPPQTSLCVSLARMMSHDLAWVLLGWLRPTIFPFFVVDPKTCSHAKSRNLCKIVFG